MNRVKMGCAEVAKTFYLSLHACWLCSPLATSASVGVNTSFPSSLLYNQINHQRVWSGYMSVCRFWNNLSSLRQFSARRGLSWLAFEQSSSQTKVDNKMASEQERKELDERARQGETIVPGGTGGKSLEAQEHLAEGRSRGGQTRREQLGHEGYQEMGSEGGQTRREQLGHEGYQEMGRKGGLSTMEKSGGERAEEEGITIDESKFRKNP